MAESGPKPSTEIAKSEIKEIPKSPETSQERLAQLSAELENLAGKIKERGKPADVGKMQEAQDTALERVAQKLHVPSQEASATSQESSENALAVDERNARVQELMQDLHEIESLIAKYGEHSPEQGESKVESGTENISEDLASAKANEETRQKTGEPRGDAVSVNNAAVDDFLRSWHESRSQKRVAQQREHEQGKEVRGDEITKELDAQKKDLGINQKEHASMQQGIESNQNETEALATEKKENGDKIDATSAHIDQSEKSIEKKQRAIESLSSEIHTLSEQHAGILRRLSGSKGDEHIALQQQADTIQGMISAKKETRTAYETEVKQLQETLEKNKAQLAELQGKEKEYVGKAEQLQHEAGELKENAANKDREITFRKQLIETLEDLVHRGVSVSDSQMDRAVLVIPGGGKEPYLKFNVA